MMITSPANPKVKLVTGLQTSRRTRQREDRFVVEGRRLVEDALTAGMAPDFVLHTPAWAASSDGARLLEAIGRAGIPSYAVSDDLFAHCSDTETPPGVLAVLPLPALAPPTAPTLVVVADRIRTPGNLGAILRTAAAAGVEAVLLPPGNTDPFNPKVVRGAMGAHFRLPLVRLGWEQARARLAGLDRWLAAAGSGQRYDQVDWTRPVALIIGGEAGGAGQEAESLAGGAVQIPMPGGMESLNAAVAAGVLLFEVVRQRSSPAGSRERPAPASG